MAPAMLTVMLKAEAAGSCAAGSSRGRIALRAGWFSPKNACWIAKMNSSSHTLRRSNAACSQNRALVPINPNVLTSRRLRRSKWSASAPPHSPNTTSGTRPNRPVSPT